MIVVGVHEFSSRLTTFSCCRHRGLNRWPLDHESKWFQLLTNVVSITLPIKRSAINLIINQTSLLRKYLAGLQHWCPSFVNGSKIYFWPFFGNFIFANFCRKKLIFSINPLWNKLAQTPSPTTTLCDRDRCDQGYIYIWFTPILQIDSPACTFQICTSYFHFFS